MDFTLHAFGSCSASIFAFRPIVDLMLHVLGSFSPSITNFVFRPIVDLMLHVFRFVLFYSNGLS